MSEFHATVWLNHEEAHIFNFNAEHADKSIVHAKHAQNGTSDLKFYAHVEEALEGATEILILGPAEAKYELVKHIEKHNKPLAHHIVAIETIDRLTDPQILAYARKRFKALDRMIG